MQDKRRILIVDRSVLAANMLKLLLARHNVKVKAVKTIEAIEKCFENNVFDLAIINSNTFSKDFDKVLSSVCDHKKIAQTEKVFLCRSHSCEASWRELLCKVPNAVVSSRPFYPDDFDQLVGAVLKGC